MAATAVPRNENVALDEKLVIHHRKARSCVMLIPSKVLISRPQPKDPVTREPQLNTVERKQHRVWLDADGNGEICGAIWLDIVASGYGHHFLIMPNNNDPMTQGLDMRTTAKVRELDVTTPQAEGRVRDMLRTTFGIYSRKVKAPING